MKTLLFGKPHIRLEIAGSTNTYARQLIEANRPESGMVISSSFQYSGRGQGIHQWDSESGKNLLCSYIFYPQIPVSHLFILNKMIACAVHQCLEKLTGNIELKIKWPNDILVNNRKIAGMLVETGIKGDEISYCIAGIGINVNQEIFRTFYPEAVSVKMLTGENTELDLVLGVLNKSLSNWYKVLNESHEKVNEYFINQLYLVNLQTNFIIRGNSVTAVITGADNEGRLLMRTANDEILKLKHGEFQYVF